MRWLRGRVWRGVLAAGMLALVPAVAAGGWALAIQVDGNVHAVAAGRLYRSAQLSPRELAAVVERHAIRTVVNLRGRAKGQRWYEAEVGAAARLGVRHIDIALSATREPDAKTLARLLTVLRYADGPILIHCKSGADRTGLAAALYQLAVAGRSAPVAAEQLSFFYGHFPWLGSETVAMDTTFARLAAGADRR